MKWMKWRKGYQRRSSIGICIRRRTMAIWFANHLYQNDHQAGMMTLAFTTVFSHVLPKCNS